MQLNLKECIVMYVTPYARECELDFHGAKSHNKS